MYKIEIINEKAERSGPKTASHQLCCSEKLLGTIVIIWKGWVILGVNRPANSTDIQKPTQFYSFYGERCLKFAHRRVKAICLRWIELVKEDIGRETFAYSPLFKSV